MTELVFFFDYRSPYAYLAHTQLRRSGIAMVYRPFDIRTLMEKVGNVPTSVICKAKNRYIQADLRRWVAHYDVQLQRHPDILKIDFGRLLRATLRAVEHPTASAVVDALFKAVWQTARPLATPADVARVLGEAGFEDSALETVIDNADGVAALERATNDAVERGVFGAPSMIIGEELFFGNDRLDFARAAWERAQ